MHACMHACAACVCVHNMAHVAGAAQEKQRPSRGSACQAQARLLLVPSSPFTCVDARAALADAQRLRVLGWVWAANEAEVVVVR